MTNISAHARLGRLERHLEGRAVPAPVKVCIHRVDGSYSLLGGYPDPAAWRAAHPGVELIVAIEQDHSRPREVRP